MRAGNYVAIPTSAGPCIAKIESVLAARAVLSVLSTGEKIYYAKGQLWKDEGLWHEFRTTGGWIHIPVYLQEHALSNAMIHWAQTKFDERDFALQEKKR